MAFETKNFTTFMRKSITFKMIIIGITFILLLIPLEFVKSLIRERSSRQFEVINEINSKWGKDVDLQGPIIKIPYKTFKKVNEYDSSTKTYKTKHEEIVHHAFFLPESLNVKAEIESKTRERSNYQSVVYTSNIKASGNFEKLDFSKLEIPDKDIQWNKAILLLNTSNLKGIRNKITIKLDTQTLQMSPKYRAESSMESDYIKNLNKDKSISFIFDIEINGSNSLNVIPVGKETTVSMTSDWHSPSFFGNYLPNDENKSVTSEGFHAEWKVLQLNRQFEQVFVDDLPNLKQFSFGTKFIIPVNDYRRTERSVKYGFMVMGLTLLVFMLIQITSKIYIHPFQYAMIGLALVMFYTLLISITEHYNFSAAYIISGVSVLSLITAYSKTILKSIKFPMLIGGSLAILYGFIYIIIQLEEYALIVGSIGLFIILAIIMFVSNKVDWKGVE